MRQDTKIALTWELLEAGVPKAHIAERLAISRRTVIRWAQGFQIASSLTAFLDSYHQAKRGPRRKRKQNTQLEWRIRTLRRRNRQCCGQKIQYFLEREYDQRVSVTTIYKVLQVDTVDFGDVYAYVAVDTFTKEGAVRLLPSLDSQAGEQFLRHCFPAIFGPHVEVIQTDGGHEFRGAFAQEAKRYCLWHRVARPYRQTEQCFVGASIVLCAGNVGMAEIQGQRHPRIELRIKYLAAVLSL